MAKHAIGTFSYPLKDAPVVEEAERLAREDGKSFSQLVLRLLKQEVSQKKEKGAPNPLNLYSFITPTEKHIDGTLDQWIRRDDAIQLIKRIDPDMAENVGKNLIIAARFRRTGIYRDVRII